MAELVVGRRYGLPAEFDAGEGIQAIEEEPCLRTATGIPTWPSASLRPTRFGHHLQARDQSAVCPITVGYPTQIEVIQAIVPLRRLALKFSDIDRPSLAYGSPMT